MSTQRPHTSSSAQASGDASLRVPFRMTVRPGEDAAAGRAGGPDGELFKDRRGRPRVLRGVAIHSGSPRLAELAAKIGFEAIWIEMEHGPTDFAAAEMLCMAVEGGGAVPVIRVPDAERHHVLLALEVGARIVVVPMVNDADQARQIVACGKFPPEGMRGYNTRSRGVNYGLAGPAAAFAEANARTHLFAQIETREAVGNLEAICAVEGLSGILIGPGDLSISYGCPGDLNNGELITVVAGCIRRARAAGRNAGILVGPGRLLDAAIEAGCNLAFYGGDVMDLSAVWSQLLRSLPAAAAKP